jgi:plastocyanin
MVRLLWSADPGPLAAAAFVLATVAALAFLSIGGERAVAGTGTTHTVFVNNSVFCDNAGFSCTQPHSLQIDAGDTVQWPDGEAGVLHTVTQCTGDGTGCPAPGGFDSGFLTDPPSGYLTLAFPDEGTFFYRCQVHGNSMRGIVTVGSPATPSATPTASPSPSPSPTASATAVPTATVTATPAPSPTPTPTPSARSDVNCDGATDGDDVLALLLHSAEAAPAAAPSGACPAIGSVEGDGVKGDLNCDSLIDARDGLTALLAWAGVPVTGLPPGCPGP